MPCRQGDHGRGVQELVLVVRPLQVVVGNAGIQMVDVVQADVAGEELEHSGQAQV